MRPPHQPSSSRTWAWALAQPLIQAQNPSLSQTWAWCSNSSPSPMPSWANPRHPFSSQPTSPPGHHLQSELPAASLTRIEVAVEWRGPWDPPRPWSAGCRWRRRGRQRVVDRGGGYESRWRRRWGEQAPCRHGACSEKVRGEAACMHGSYVCRRVALGVSMEMS